MSFCAISDSAVGGFLSPEVMPNFHCHSQSKEKLTKKDQGAHGLWSSYLNTTQSGGSFSQA